MEALEEKLGYRFTNRAFLENALTHSSYANENKAKGLQSNERLEFLGDSVLGMVVADYLFRTHPDLPEGDLTRTRAALVCEGSLVEVAQCLELGAYLKLGKGEEAGGGRERPLGYLFETTFQREATSDLTGERGSLMGAIQGLLLAQYEVLRENGHSPSEAFNETVEELTQSLMPLFAKNGMDWMYANCSTTAQRGALDWMTPFHDAIKPVVEKLYHSVKTGNEAQISIDSNSKPDYREKLEEELKALRESEMWQTAVTVRKLRPENN